MFIFKLVLIHQFGPTQRTKKASQDYAAPGCLRVSTCPAHEALHWIPSSTGMAEEQYQFLNTGRDSLPEHLEMRIQLKSRIHIAP